MIEVGQTPSGFASIPVFAKEPQPIDISIDNKPQLSEAWAKFVEDFVQRNHPLYMDNVEALTIQALLDKKDRISPDCLVYLIRDYLHAFMKYQVRDAMDQYATEEHYRRLDKQLPQRQVVRLPYPTRRKKGLLAWTIFTHYCRRCQKLLTNEIESCRCEEVQTVQHNLCFCQDVPILEVRIS